MFGRTWRLGRVAGITIEADVSWSVIAVLVALSFYGRIDVVHPELSTGATVALAVAGAAGLFASVLLHELAHAVVSEARGIPVEGITLFLFGGATRARVESKEPRDELVISIVGPLTSFGLAALLWAVTGLWPDADAPVPDTVGYLGWINLALAVFNLLPGFPLDGGRVLRSVAWMVTGSLTRATRLAASGGRAVGYLLIGVGLASVLAGGIGGLWLAFIGWFLAQAATASSVQLQVRRLLQGVAVGDVMARDLVTIPGDITLQDAVDGWFLRSPHSAFPVVDDGGAAGVLTLRAVRRLAPADRPRTLVRDCMTPLAAAAVVRPDDPVQEVVDRFEDDAVDRVLVVHDGRIVGLVTRSDVARWVQRIDELGLAGLDDGGRGAAA